MNDLMLYVERIVRPIRAAEPRKLRMRRELLAHLEATVEEERARAPRDDDDSAAVERAASRLGEPGALARALQRTVPIAERVLLARLPMSSRLEAIERRLARFPGKLGAMTLGHSTGVAALAAAVGMPFIIAMHAIATPGQPAIHLALSLLVLPPLWVALLIACFRFVFVAAGPTMRLEVRGALACGAIVLVLQITLTALDAFVVADRLATAREIAGVGIGSVATLLTAGYIARRVGVWRRPYDQWLSLELSDA